MKTKCVSEPTAAPYAPRLHEGLVMGTTMRSGIPKSVPIAPRRKPHALFSSTVVGFPHEPIGILVGGGNHLAPIEGSFLRRGQAAGSPSGMIEEVGENVSQDK
jgi:hypothetical protein